MIIIILDVRNITEKLKDIKINSKLHKKLKLQATQKDKKLKEEVEDLLTKSLEGDITE